MIDNQGGIKEPLGMSGVRLEAKVHLVTCAETAAQNIEKCVQRCGLRVDGIVLEQLASSYSVITDDERDLGVCMVDIGGGTSDIAVFTEGSIRHTGVIPVAGDQVTSDIAMARARRRNTRKKSKFDTPARLHSSPALKRRLKCRALVIVHHATCLASR